MFKTYRRLMRTSRFRMIMMCLYIVIILGVGYNLSSSFIRLRSRQSTLKQLVAQQKQLEIDQKALAQEVEQLKDDDYVIRYARDHYIFSADGEKVIVLPEDDESDTQQQ